jgi:hypothetical protein
MPGGHGCQIMLGRGDKQMRTLGAQLLTPGREGLAIRLGVAKVIDRASDDIFYRGGQGA